MKLPGLSLLKDKWVLIGLAAGAGIYWFTNKHGYGGYERKIEHPWDWPEGGTGGGGYSLTDRPGLYEVPGNQGDFSHMRFSGQAELQRRLTVV